MSMVRLRTLRAQLERAKDRGDKEEYLRLIEEIDKEEC